MLRLLPMLAPRCGRSAACTSTRSPTGGQVAVGHLGDARFLVDGRDVVYDAPAALVRGRLYLPPDLILTLTGGKSK